jgi:hypothetical protein
MVCISDPFAEIVVNPGLFTSEIVKIVSRLIAGIYAKTPSARRPQAPARLAL